MVPGYLVPLMLVKPWSATVVVIEGAVTYGLVWLYSEKLSPAAGYTNFFGRDRFFALLLVSVIVRLCFDVLLWPAIGEQINTVFHLNFDYRNNLHSFGLIVVALIANQFWKPGLRKGIVVLAITVLCTFLLVRFVLMPFTNFHVGNLAYMYENLAASMLAGPKAYIILLTTAFIASHLNLRYGWEYSGIMIPALLALEWYQPFKLFVTFVETFVILLAAILLLKIPFFQRKTIEGARKIVFFFNISFVYKILLGHLIINYFPRYAINDYYGFGYLLSTLLAVKMHDKEIAARVTRASLQTSFASLVVATIIGFGLVSIPNVFSILNRGETSPEPVAGQKEIRTLIELVREEQVSVYTTIRRNSVPTALAQEIDTFREALRLLQGSVHGQNEPALAKSRQLLRGLRYSLHLVENTYLVLREEEPKRGWGMYVINMQPANALQLQVPEPIGEWGTSSSGLALFKTFSAGSLAIAGSRRNANDDGSADVLASNKTFFYAFQQIFGKKEIVQIRGLTDKERSRISGQHIVESAGNHSAATSILMIASSLPQGCNMSVLQNSIGRFEVLWHRSPFVNQLRKSSSAGFAELFLTREDRRELLFKPFFAVQALTSLSSVKSIVGYLQEWLFAQKGAIAAKDSNAYLQPSLEALLFFDQEILTPLVAFIEHARTAAQWSNEDRDELRVVKNAASILGYDLNHYRHKITGHEYLILAENDLSLRKKFWGTYVFRLGPAKDYILQVPRPLSERNIFEYSVSLFDNLQARALLISGTHPLANSDGSADIIRQENKANLFNLVNQVLLRQAGPQPILVVQCRAFAYKTDIPPPDANALIALYSGLSLSPRLPPLTTQLMQVLQEQYRFSVKVVSGAADEAGYEVGGIPQALYLDQTANKEFLNLWLSPLTRAAFRQQTENRLLESHFAPLQIQTLERELYSYLLQEKPPVGSPAKNIDMDNLKKSIAAYVHSYDILAMQQVLKDWPELQFQQVIDVNSKQAFLVVLNGKGQSLLVANLHPLLEDSHYRLHPGLSRDVLNTYIDSRSFWLAAVDSP